MEKEYKVLSDDVIVSSNNLYFTRVCSAETLERKFYDEESEYGMWFENVEIALKEKNTFTSAIRATFSNEEEGKMHYIEVIYSGVLGLFVSDWH